MSDPNLPPNSAAQFQPPPQERSGMPKWAIALIAITGISVVLCAVLGVAAFGALSLLGARTEQVFDDIETELSSPGTFQEATAVAVEMTYAVGERATLGDLELTVQSAGPVAANDQELPPTAGNVYYTVQFEASNTGSSMEVLSVFNSQIQDASATVYTPSLFGQSSGETSASEFVTTLDGAATTTATYVYEVPEDASELYWVYQSSSGEAIVYKLK